jgi:hypothetical protein
MSHTKKKFITIKSNITNPDDLFIKSTEENSKHTSINIDEYDSGFYISDDGKKMTTVFSYSYKNKLLLIPEPDITILYLSFVEKNVEKIINIRKEILELARKQNKESTANIAFGFYNFFQLSSSFVIFLMMSLEAFNNSLIPNKHIYINKKRKKYIREGIQRSIKFEEKFKRVIPQLFNKSFVGDFNIKFELLRKMKCLRDDVVHTKNFNGDFYASYREIYKKYLEFDFENALLYTKDYINYYKPNHIEACDCEIDFKTPLKSPQGDNISD